MAPCQNLVTSEEYKNIVRQAELFLSGKQSELMKQLQEQMQKYAEVFNLKKPLNFETAIMTCKKHLKNKKLFMKIQN